ncbi:hypothetical protein D3C75_715540 [compost metagenome]
MINQVVQQVARITALHAANHFLAGFKLRHQFFQRFASNGWCVGVGVQRCAIQCDCDLVLVHRFIIFDVLLLLAFLHFVQRWLCDIHVAAFNDFRHLTVEEGQQQSTNV